MKSGAIALTILLYSMGLAVPVMAQLRNPSQDFFERGREQLEREIQVLQGESPDSEQSRQQPDSEPLLDVRPAPESRPNPIPEEDDPSSPKPDAGDSSGYQPRDSQRP